MQAFNAVLSITDEESAASSLGELRRNSTADFIRPHGHCLQQKVRCAEMQIDAGQFDPKVRARIAIHIGLHEGISAAFVPGHAVCNDAAVLTRECKCLVAILGGVCINGRNINHVSAMNEILDDIKLGGRAVR